MAQEELARLGYRNAGDRGNINVGLTSVRLTRQI